MTSKEISGLLSVYLTILNIADGNSFGTCSLLVILVFSMWMEHLSGDLSIDTSISRMCVLRDLKHPMAILNLLRILWKMPLCWMF